MRRHDEPGLLRRLSAVVAFLGGASPAAMALPGSAPPAPAFGLRDAVPDGWEAAIRVDRFEGMELQESTDFDGVTALAEVAFPTRTEDVRLRVVFPFWTEGDAVLTQAGDEPGEVVGAPTHIEGTGGVHEFFAVDADWQVFRSADGRRRLAAMAGAGIVISPLHTTFGDKTNHQGNDIDLGVAAGADLPLGFAVSASNVIDFYWQGDDLGPSDRGWPALLDSWVLWKQSVSAFSPSILGLRVGGELVAATDLLDYHPVSAIPQVSWSGWGYELRGAWAVGLTDRADDRRIRVELRHRWGAGGGGSAAAGPKSSARGARPEVVGQR